MRQAFDKGFCMGGALASAMTVTSGKLPPKELAALEPTPTAARAHRPRPHYPAPDGTLHLRQALVRLRLGQQDERRPAEPHPGGDERAARLAEMWARMCPAQVYEVGEENGDGTVHCS